MSQAIATVRLLATGSGSSRLRQTVAALWRSLAQGLLDPYRPELHYMRGPGPKWREKHGNPGGAVAGVAGNDEYSKPALTAA